MKFTTATSHRYNGHSRYINVTLIDLKGSATSTQIYTSSMVEVEEWLNERLPKGSWGTRFIAGFVHDTAESVTYRFDVIAINEDSDLANIKAIENIPRYSR